MEHRWGARARIDIPVRLDCGSSALVLGVLRDASVSGAFLCTAAQLELLTCVRVELRAARLSPLHSSIDAHVVRRTHEGFGLEWTQLAPAAIVALLSESVREPMHAPALAPSQREVPASRPHAEPDPPLIEADRPALMHERPPSVM